jgi:predicted nucleic acid-binding protein
METVTLSSKYELVLPRGARERLGLRPGMRINGPRQGRRALPSPRAADVRLSGDRPRGQPQGIARKEGPSLTLVLGRLDRIPREPVQGKALRRVHRGRDPLLVSAIEIYEVYKVIWRDLSEERAIEAVSALRRATIAPVDAPPALEAADLLLAHGLAMADSLVYATARRFGATLVTGDSSFEGLPDTVVVG